MPNKKNKQKQANKQSRNPRSIPKQVSNIVRQKAQQKPPVKQRPMQGLLSALGSAAGGYLGGPLGSMLGKGAGDLISRITGFGDYKVNRNSITEGNTVPTFRSNNDGVEICHREFIGDVKSHIAFSLSFFNLNPGLPGTFPWLSQIASYFEEYEMRGLVFEYRPASGSAVSGTNPAMGVVVMATDYNVLSPLFTTKQQMESYEYSTSCVPFESMIHPIECAPRSNVNDTLFIRTTVTQGSLTSDLRLYDMGKMELAVQGQQGDNNNLGELWVSYHVFLKKPRINPNGNGLYAHLASSLAGSATAADPLGTAGAILASDSTLSGITPISTTVFEIDNPGVYWITVSSYTSAADIAAAPGLSLGSNIATDGDPFANETLNSVGAFNAAATYGTLSEVVIVKAAGPGTANQITISGLTGLTAGDTDVYIFPMPYSIN